MKILIMFCFLSEQIILLIIYFFKEIVENKLSGNNRFCSILLNIKNLMKLNLKLNKLLTESSKI